MKILLGLLKANSFFCPQPVESHTGSLSLYGALEPARRPGRITKLPTSDGRIEDRTNWAGR